MGLPTGAAPMDRQTNVCLRSDIQEELVLHLIGVPIEVHVISTEILRFGL
jgi:hypothetical protein